MRNRLLALLITVGVAIGLSVASALPASACHKGKAHGKQDALVVEPVQEEPIFCGNLPP